MTELLRPQEDYSPWAPIDGDDYVVYHEFNRPLIGVVYESGRAYLFNCVAGHQDDVSVWVYIPVSGPEIKEFESSGDIDLSLERLTTDREVTVALADSRSGILGSTALFFRGGTSLDLAEAAIDALKWVAPKARELTDLMAETKALQAAR